MTIEWAHLEILIIGAMLGSAGGLAFGLWLAHKGASKHVEAVNRITKEAAETAGQAKRISLHVADQYVPLRVRLEAVEHEILLLQQQVHSLINELPPEGNGG